MSEGLKKQSKKALIWNGFDKIGAQVIAIFVGLYLARHISPHDFGLIGMLGIFTGLANIVLDSGFSSALIRKKDCTETDFSTVFFFNLIISIFLYSILFFSAPYIAEYFRYPILVPLSRIIFLTIILNSLVIIQNVKIQKDLDFKKIAFVNLSALLISSSVAILLAFLNYGAWCIVFQMITLSATKAVMLWSISKWKPRFIISFSTLKELFSYSSSLLLASIFSTFFLNAYSFIFGKYYNSNAAGYYTQANKWSDMFVNTIYATIITATFPIFSSAQHDEELLLKTYRKTIRLTAFIVFPALFGATLVGQSLIEILLGKTWEESGFLFQLLCIGGLFTPFTGLNANFIIIKGKTNQFLYFEITKAVLAIVALLITVHMGIAAILIGQIAVRAIQYFITVFIVGKQVNYPWQLQLKDMLPYIGLSGIMIGIVYPIQYIFSNPYLLTTTQVLIAILFYFLANKRLNSKVLEEVISTFKRKK